MKTNISKIGYSLLTAVVLGFMGFLAFQFTVPTDLHAKKMSNQERAAEKEKAEKEAKEKAEKEAKEKEAKKK